MTNYRKTDCGLCVPVEKDSKTGKPVPHQFDFVILEPDDFKKAYEGFRLLWQAAGLDTPPMTPINAALYQGRYEAFQYLARILVGGEIEFEELT